MNKVLFESSTASSAEGADCNRAGATNCGSGSRWVLLPGFLRMGCKVGSMSVLLVTAALSVSCADDTIKKSGDKGGTITGTISYSGTQSVSRVGIAVFDEPNNPPTTPPEKAIHVPSQPLEGGVKFPLDFAVQGLDNGTYYLMIYGDVDPDDTAMGPKYGVDPMSPFLGPVTISDKEPNRSVQVVLTDPSPDTDVIDEPDTITDDSSSLEDSANWDIEGDAGPEFPAAEPVKPKAGKAGIYGAVVYQGDKSGKLVLAGFASNPPTGPPKFFYYVEKPEFPQVYSYGEIDPGKHFMIAYLDVDPNDGFAYTDKDPRSKEWVELELAAGDALLVNAVLLDPAQ